MGRLKLLAIWHMTGKYFSSLTRMRKQSCFFFSARTDVQEGFAWCANIAHACPVGRGKPVSPGQPSSCAGWQADRLPRSPRSRAPQPPGQLSSQLRQPRTRGAGKSGQLAHEVGRLPVICEPGRAAAQHSGKTGSLTAEQPWSQTASTWRGSHSGKPDSLPA